MDKGAPQSQEKRDVVAAQFEEPDGIGNVTR